MAIPKRYEDRSRAELVVKGALEEVQSLVAPARGDPPVRFCIYGQGRTGSTLLTSLLDSHPDITCPDEILRRPKVAPLAYLRRRMRQAETRAFGFHVKFRQIEYFARVPDQRAFLDALEAEGWRFVYLRRADLFAQCFSNAFARELRQFHFTEEEGPPKDRRIEIRPAKLVRDIERRIHWGEAERAALEGRLHFEIVYERDMLDPEVRPGTLVRLLDWLDVLSDAPLATPLKKSVSRPPWEMIANRDEVRAALDAAGLGHMVPGV